MIDDILAEIEERNPHQPTFVQAAREIVGSLEPALKRYPEFVEHRMLQRLIEPERIIQFRVPWMDDEGLIRVNRGWRVQFSSVLGPYKGGLRFSPAVSVDVLKFLGFEQIFKNSLTYLPLGAGKGGSDFNPRHRSRAEVMRFCQSFMTELYRWIGPDRDVPAGDIGVASREIGFLQGQYRRLTGESVGAITGKPVEWGGSRLREEATGFGVAYFAAAMQQAVGRDISGQRCLVSGAGNVAVFTAQRLTELGARVLTLSDSRGWIHDPDGFDDEKLAWIRQRKLREGGRLEGYEREFKGASYHERDDKSNGDAMWAIEADAAFPCAMENEIDAALAQRLIDAGVSLVCEGANMPLTNDAIHLLQEGEVRYAPGKAANAGGVTVSLYEMSQNRTRLPWSRDEVDQRLRASMQAIHDRCHETAESYGRPGNYAVGANICGFLRVARAMIEQGVV